jgi:hypothetical protein
MLGRLLLGAALALLPSAAHACQCEDPAQLSQSQFENDLKLMTSRQLYIGRVMRVDNNLPGQARRYQVIDDLTGNLPEVVIVQPNLTRLPDGTMIEGPQTSCDFHGVPGNLITMAFQTSGADAKKAPCDVTGAVSDSGLRSAGQCVNLWLEDRRASARLVAAARAQAGVSLSKRPPSSSR